MTQWNITRAINAPIDVVFKTVAHINEFSRAVPQVVKVEFLSDLKSGVGTKFRETRLMKGKESTTELEVTEYVPNDHVRIVADTHRTIWDTVFSVKREGDQTLLTMHMDARTGKLIPKILITFIKGMVGKAVAKDMDSVKEYCEKQGQ